MKIDENYASADNHIRSITPSRKNHRDLFMKRSNIKQQRNDIFEFPDDLMLAPIRESKKEELNESIDKK
jgi:hypothetical protein